MRSSLQEEPCESNEVERCPPDSVEGKYVALLIEILLINFNTNYYFLID